MREIPQTMWWPGSSRARHASASRAASAGESQVDRLRTLSATGVTVPILAETTDMPYASAYRLPRASAVALLTP
ncbi:hypothetical protein [Thermocatellispora tengchongensis]|uniref:hypothetical protein n=1 Tax=Thermocatellispora tengchongensis TaxID=1073253 RepID=UPI0036429ED0